MINKLKNKTFLFVSINVLMILPPCIALSAQPSDDTILFKVGSKTVTKTEFMHRAEFTPRPDYCKFNNYIHKKITLNTLIAEKLLALEAGNDNELTNSDEFNYYITGRKEQAMRQIHFYEKAYLPSKPNNSTIAKVYELAGRTYNISYIKLNDSKNSHNLYQKLSNSQVNFDSVITSETSLDTIPTREINYFNEEDPLVIKALFFLPIVKGQILPPLSIDNSFLIIKVNGWTERVVINEQDRLRQWRDVETKLTEIEASKKYDEYVSELMRGKRVEFNPTTFTELIKILAPYYIKSDKEKKVLLKNKFWEPGSEDEILIDYISNVDDIKSWELLKIDNESWTIERLVQEIKTHPLVFRNQKVKKNNFAEQMKLSIVDLIRDKFITMDAYKNRMDDNTLVYRNIEIWKENLLAIYQKYNVLNSIEYTSLGRMEILESIMNPYIRELQKKYSAVIEINVQEFESLKLSSIDMIALQPNMAYPLIVPLFPELTTLTQLDYGRRTEE